MNEFLEKLLLEMSGRLTELVEARVAASLDRYFKTPAKITFTEREAAAFLGVGVATLQIWRKDGLINFVNYPSAQPGLANETGLSSMFSYDIGDLLDFRDRYKRKHYQPKFEVKKEISVFGAEVGEITKLRKVA